MKDIERIISELEQQRSAIDRAISALREVTGTPTPTSQAPATSKPQPTTTKSQIGREGRAGVTEARRKPGVAKRAAEHSGGSQQNARPASTRMSPEGRKRIAESNKRRALLQKQSAAAGKPSAPAPAKKNIRRGITPEGRARLAEAVRQRNIARAAARKKAASQ